MCARPGLDRIITAMGTAARATIAVITARRLGSSNPYKQKGEPLGLPLFYFAVSSRKTALTTRVFRKRRAPRERCDQLSFCSKPGGVMLPSGAR